MKKGRDKVNDDINYYDTPIMIINLTIKKAFKDGEISEQGTLKL